MSEPIRLFISFCDQDTEWLDRLKDLLSPLKEEGRIEIWDETCIAAGANTREEIDKARDSAHAAILLVSAKYIASNHAEMKALVSRREAGMEFFWIPITAALYENTPLNTIVTLGDKNKPLAGIRNWQSALAQIAQKIAQKLGGGAPDLGDNKEGVIANVRPSEVKEPAGSRSGPSDTDQLLVALIDREDQEAPIEERSRSPTGPTLFVVPGPIAQEPSLFLKRLKDHTCNELLQELKKGNRSLIHADIGWPSFPESAAVAQEAIDTKLKRVLVAACVSKAQVNVESIYGEALDDYAIRAFKAIRDTNPATLHVFVLQLVNSKPRSDECQCFVRFANLWEKFCSENPHANMLVIFIANASRTEFDAGYGGTLAGLRHAAVIDEMPNILYNDISTWLRDNRLSTCFNTSAIDKRARILVAPERNEGIQMTLLAEEAARWLSDNRIKR